MKLAILFWFYREPAVCRRRLQRLRRLNPQTRIYGLYGGEPARSGEFASLLGDELDDFYAFPPERTPHWKWRNGDLMIADWFIHRGSALEWDTVFVAQWDLLLLDSLDSLCRNLAVDELLLPGLRPLAEVYDWWWWTRPGSPEREEYLRFVEVLGAGGGAPRSPLCCNAIALGLPRAFLRAYVAIEQPELGFLEYKLPMYAQVFGFRFCRDHPFQPEWIGEFSGSLVARRVKRIVRTLHAEKLPIPWYTVAAHAALPRGRRVFHPYVGTLF